MGHDASGKKTATPNTTAFSILTSHLLPLLDVFFRWQISPGAAHLHQRASVLREAPHDAVPEPRETEHFYYRYSDFNDDLENFLENKTGWRNHVLNFAKGWVQEEGLIDRAITRDLDWGVRLPVDDLGEGKRIYVWYDAVIG